MLMTCRTRFAPSPTGYLHIGGVRTALYSWLYARQHQGEFLLRIEDTDRQRSTKAAIDAILTAMDWLGLTYDQPPIYQSQRLARYQEVAAQLLGAGHAYYAYESKEELDAMRQQAILAGTKPRYNNAARDRNLPYRNDPNRVLRFKNPTSGVVEFADLIKGKITIDNGELDDVIIVRSDGMPTYNFAVVVDDWDMQITEVIRGDDHINNTPRQINLYHALGALVPRFAHVPMILDAHGAKLSKRTGAADVMSYQHAGYLPEALLNYLVRLGWSHGDQEVFTVNDMLRNFDIGHVHRNPARLDRDKLTWLNQHYLQTLPVQTMVSRLQPRLEEAGVDIANGPAVGDVVEALRRRVGTLADLAEKAQVWYRPLTDYDPGAVAKHLTPQAREPLMRVQQMLQTLMPWTSEAIGAALKNIATELAMKMGALAQPLRVAITGTQVSPDIAQTVYLAGRQQALARIAVALDKTLLSQDSPLP